MSAPSPQGGRLPSLRDEKRRCHGDRAASTTVLRAAVVGQHRHREQKIVVTGGILQRYALPASAQIPDLGAINTLLGGDLLQRQVYHRAPVLFGPFQSLQQ